MDPSRSIDFIPNTRGGVNLVTTEAYSATLTHMTAAVQAVQAPSISRFVAAELRAEIARAGITQNEVARRLRAVS